MIVIGFRAHPKRRWFRFKIFILIISAKKFISKRSHSEILGTQFFWGPQFNLQQDLLLPESFLKMIILYLNNYLKNFLCLQFSSVTQSCLTLCDPMDCSMPGFPVHHQLHELAQTHVHWVSDAIQPSYALLFPLPPAFDLSQHQGLFQWVSSSHQVGKRSFSIIPSNEYLGLIFFRIDWFDLLAVQGTLKSLLQHHSSKASILRCSAFFMVQLSNPYMTTGKPLLWLRLGPLLAK